MSGSTEERALALRLQQAGCTAAVSKSGRLLRVVVPAEADASVSRLLPAVVQCDRLRELGIRGRTGLVNGHIEAISRLPRLQTLDLEGTDLSDESLIGLAGCPALKIVNVRNTAVTPACVATRRKTMIGTRIIAS